MAYKYDEYGADREKARSQFRQRERELGGRACGKTWTKWDSRIVFECGKPEGHEGMCGKGIQIGSDGRRW